MVAAAMIGRRCLKDRKFMFASPGGLQDEYAGVADVHAHGLSRLELARAGIDEVDGASVVEPHDDAVAVTRLRIVLGLVRRRRRIAELDRLDVLNDARRQLVEGAGRMRLRARGEEQRNCKQKIFHTVHGASAEWAV